MYDGWDARGIMVASVRDVARYLLNQADPDVGELISHLKLQKLCYYAQGFHLALFDQPFFPERIEAWTHGPVSPDLYVDYRSYASGPIPVPETSDFSVLSDDQRGLLDEVYEVYGQYSAWKLRNMTHEEAPWIEAAKNGGGVITHDAMREFFKTRLK